ncbi:SEL1-like repeat protein [Noviherbaspirillum pedocola]|uniref:SEL1-like repeat protein n=1 Tax=Noviherbaspirillum pedocola TaxID=2801341 RepID=A0A934W0V8_9BURK|nr:SEL1-like repeat protein [Noviherbaspirillum pedocola]MBK4734531.1 SEL1-like repeat protein [Noviherbaspirillum pedocola]
MDPSITGALVQSIDIYPEQLVSHEEQVGGARVPGLQPQEQGATLLSTQPQPGAGSAVVSITAPLLLDAAPAGNGVASIAVNTGATRGLDWCMGRAERGDAGAQFELGMYYLQGERVQKNPETALLWFHKAAQQGDARAQYHLYLQYESGESVKRDHEKAIDSLIKSAVGGNREANKLLSEKYRNGCDVDRDLEKSAVCLLRSEDWPRSKSSTLKLRGSAIDDAMLKAILGLLRKHLQKETPTQPQVLELLLDHNAIREKGATYLAEMLVQHVALQILTMSGNLIGIAGLETIENALRSNTSLLKFVCRGYAKGGISAKAVIDAIYEQIERNGRVFMLTNLRKQWKFNKWTGMDPDLMLQLEESLILRMSKLGNSSATETLKSLLELQLCLSLLENDYSARPQAQLMRSDEACSPSSASKSGE